MEFLENNYVTFDNNNNNNLIYIYELGKIINSTKDLVKVFGYPIKLKEIYMWKFKMNNSKFKIYKNEKSKYWYLSSNTNNSLIIYKFNKFLIEVKKVVNSLRNLHKSIPIYDKNHYQLKNKIALYTIPPKEPPKNIKIYKEKENIPKKNKYGELIFKDYSDFKPNLTPKEVIQFGSFGGTYFRSIMSGITGKIYKDVWKEFPKDWFRNLDIEKYITSIVIQKEINKYKIKMGGNLDMWVCY
jgi:hypothetical protein